MISKFDRALSSNVWFGKSIYIQQGQQVILPKNTKEHQSYYNFISLKAFNFTTLKHVNQILTKISSTQLLYTIS